MSSKNNILLGLDNDGKKLYSDNQDYKHILLIAPHGSGKGTCFVLPSLLTFEESVIVHDIKMENYELTSGYRASTGHKIFVWNPLGAKEKTNRYNPLDFISQDHYRIIDDIQKIVHLLIGNTIDYSTSAKTLLTSIILYLYVNTTRTKSFGEIARMLDGDLIEELSNVDKLKDNLHPFAYQQIRVFLKKDREEQNSIIRVLNNYLVPWKNPLVDYATSASDFDIADFKKNKTTLYVGVNPADINRLQPIMQFFYQHVADRLMTTAQKLGHGEENKGVCLLMDEFYSVGKLEAFASCMPYFRGYRIKLFLITSDIEKIEKTYGESAASSIISDCSTKIAFAARSYKTANKISQLCLDKSSNTELMSWQKIINLHSDSQIILRDDKKPIISKKLFYYEVEEIKKRIIKPITLC